MKSRLSRKLLVCGAILLPFQAQAIQAQGQIDPVAKELNGYLQDINTKLDAAKVATELARTAWYKEQKTDARNAYSSAVASGLDPSDANSIAAKFCDRLRQESKGLVKNEDFACPIMPELSLGVTASAATKAAKVDFETKEKQQKALQAQYSNLSGQFEKWRLSKNLNSPPPTPTPSTSLTAIKTKEIVDRAKTPCGMDDRLSRLAINTKINDCTNQASSATSIVPGLSSGVLDRRGISAELAVGQSTGTLALTFKDTWNFLKPGGFSDDNGRDKNRKRTRQARFFAYSLGIETDVDEDNSSKGRLGINGDDDDDRDLLDLDRLDANFRFKAAFSFNFFKWENEDAFDARAKKLFEEAQAACEAEKNKIIRICSGNPLIQWIFSKKKDGGEYANPKMVKKFNKVYWGAKEDVPRWGFGTAASIARPEVTFANLVNAKNEIDISQADDAFFSGDSDDKKRKLTFTLAPFVYFHDYSRKDKTGVGSAGWLQSKNGGTTFKAALSFAREFEEIDAQTVCRTLNPGDLFLADENCRSTIFRRPQLVTKWRPSFEIRQKFKNVPLLAQVGIGPNFSYDTQEKKYRAELPVWLGLNEDKMSAGLSISRVWDKKEDTSETGIHLFVGTTFSLNGFD